MIREETISPGFFFPSPVSPRNALSFYEKILRFVIDF